MAAQPKQETHVETPDLFKDAEAVIATARQQVETALKVAEAGPRSTRARSRRSPIRWTACGSCSPRWTARP